MIYYAFHELNRGRQRGLDNWNRFGTDEILMYLSELGYEGLDLIESISMIRDMEDFWFKFIKKKQADYDAAEERRKKSKGKK